MLTAAVGAIKEESKMSIRARSSADYDYGTVGSGESTRPGTRRDVEEFYADRDGAGLAERKRNLAIRSAMHRRASQRIRLRERRSSSTTRTPRTQSRTRRAASTTRTLGTTSSRRVQTSATPAADPSPSSPARLSTNVLGTLRTETPRRWRERALVGGAR